MFQLGRHMTSKGNEIAPVRSTSAAGPCSSTNINRERIYVQQPPISAAGFSSQAFAPHFPHTRAADRDQDCSDCHLSAANDNNANHGAADAAGHHISSISSACIAGSGCQSGFEAPVRVTRMGRGRRP